MVHALSLRYASVLQSRQTLTAWIPVPVSQSYCSGLAAKIVDVCLLPSHMVPGKLGLLVAGIQDVLCESAVLSSIMIAIPTCAQAAVHLYLNDVHGPWLSECIAPLVHCQRQ